MRVISGILKGKKLEGFDIEGTRPTQDRVKESLFSIIQNDIKDATCLDLFAGSGSLGIEALSNGAKYVIFNDYQKKAIEVIKSNLNSYKENNYEIKNMDYKLLLDNIDKKFDIIFLDPPYKMDCINDIIDKVLNRNLLNKNGIIVCEIEFDNFTTNYDNLELIKEKKYGYKNIKILKKKN